MAKKKKKLKKQEYTNCVFPWFINFVKAKIFVYVELITIVFPVPIIMLDT